MFGFSRNQILMGLLNPILIVSYFLQKLPFNILFMLRLDLDALPRPNYAYGLWSATQEAKKLGIESISTIEFGVGDGTGLIILEKLAKRISKITKVSIDVYGFDLGSGLPSLKGYKDMPYIWKSQLFKMDRRKLENKLKNAKLIIGDIKYTIPEFSRRKIAPIGFVAFDLDLYSSTVEALKIFLKDSNKLLPRTFCYFDEIIGTSEENYSKYSGELLAIEEFNSLISTRKLAPINGLVYCRTIRAGWCNMIYVLHIFNHKRYNDYIYSSHK